VLHGTGTFELDPPDLAEMSRRRDDVLSKGLPWLVAQERGDPAAPVLGYAYANHFRPRKAYRFCLEDSIYLHPEARGRGVGKLLLAELVAPGSSAPRPRRCCRPRPSARPTHCAPNRRRRWRR
jgi:L-amino acid N-acyltransferase YncA